MKKSILPLLGIVLGLLSSAGPAYAGAVTFPSAVFPESSGVQLKGGNTSDANLAEIQAVGFKYVRRGFVWSNIEKKPGEYTFNEYDALVDNAEKRGLHVLGCIALNNGKFPGVKEAEGREAFARFAATVVARYKGRPVIWEIWNEPNIATFWGKHGKANTDAFADEYSAFVKVVAPAMRKANPDAVIVAGSVNLYEASFHWMERCFKNGILQTGINGWSVHPYSTKSPEGHLDYYTRIRKMFVENGAPADFALLNTERGYPIGKAEGYAGGDPALSKEYQSWHFVRQYLCDVIAGVKLSIWYEWGGREGFAIKPPGEPMPVMNAAKVMYAQLQGYTLSERISLASPLDYALVFTMPDGGMKIVAWTTPPPKESPDKIVTHDVSIPVKVTGSLASADLYGTAGTVVVKQGSITLTLSGAPQYVTLRSAR